MEKRLSVQAFAHSFRSCFLLWLRYWAMDRGRGSVHALVSHAFVALKGYVEVRPLMMTGWD